MPRDSLSRPLVHCGACDSRGAEGARTSRAVLFDLDDTLYPYRRFVVSGFAAVATELSDRYGLDARAAFRMLCRASRGPARGSEIQVVLAASQLPPTLAPALIHRLNQHTPRLRLPRASAAVLADLRRSGWSIGIITNGTPDIQRRKIDQLGLMHMVDAAVCAAEFGSGCGKPESAPFIELSRQLQVAPERTVVVGDSEECDVAGAIATGMHAILCTTWRRHGGSETRAKCIISRFSLIPEAAYRLVTAKAGLPRRSGERGERLAKAGRHVA